jgi:KaiC/GvpD/RAD55 family RecA-like ATPase
MNKVDRLKVLFMVGKDTELLDKIKSNKIHNDHENYYKVIKELNEIGVKDIFKLDGDGEISEFVKDNYAETIKVLGTFEGQEIDSERLIHKFNKKFPTMDEGLAGRRECIREELAAQFNISGFPLPILKGKLNSIVAPSHTGKTIYGIALALTLAREGKEVLFLTTEEDQASFEQKTMSVELSDPAWENLTIIYGAKFNEKTWEQFIKDTSDDHTEFLVIDYLKKSMWAEKLSDHVVMEEMNSILLKVNAELENKLSIFAFVQGNRLAFDAKKASLEELVKDTSQVALMIDGGMPVYRSADNLIFIKNEKGQRYLVVAKCRRNYDMVGSRTQYNVDLDTMNITMSKTLFEAGVSKKKVGDPAKVKKDIGGMI